MMGVGVEADCDLAPVRNMGSDSGDELQIIHPLLFLNLFRALPTGCQGSKEASQ